MEVTSVFILGINVRQAQVRCITCLGVLAVEAAQGITRSYILH